MALRLWELADSREAKRSLDSASVTRRWIAMHSPAPPTVMAEHCGYEDVVAEVTEALAGAAAEAARMGAPKVWIDPGIGFGKDLGGNLDLLAHLDHLVATGWPVALGTSRKSSLGVLSGNSSKGRRWRVWNRASSSAIASSAAKCGSDGDSHAW